MSPEDQTTVDGNSDGPMHSSAPLPEIEAVLSDPTASHWLKGALHSAMDRDPVAALNDALVLAAVLEQRLRVTLGIESERATEDDG